MLKINQLFLNLGSRTVLDDIRADIPSGVTVIVGPNGSGKTSLLRVLANIQKPDAGQIHWQDQNLAKMDQKQRAKNISYLAQNPPVHWPLQAESLVMLGRIGQTESRQQSLEATRRAMQTCGVLQFAKRPMNQLSGGERARVLLSRALCVEAELILVDEPTAALDPAQQLAMMEILQAQGNQGKTVLCVLHDIPLAARFADRMIVFDRAKISAMGRPKDILSGPQVKQAFSVSFTAKGHVR